VHRTLLLRQLRRRVTWRETPRLSLVLSGFILHVFISHDRSLPVHSFDGNESKSMMMIITLMTRSNVSSRSIGIGIGIEENERNATMMLLLLLLLLDWLTLRPAEKYGSHADGNVRMWMRIRRLSDISFFSLTRGNGMSSALITIASHRVLLTVDTYLNTRVRACVERFFLKLALNRSNGQDDSLSPSIDLQTLSTEVPSTIGWFSLIFLLDQRLAH